MLIHRLNHWFNFHVHLSVHRQSHRSHVELIRSGIFNAFIKYFKITKNKANSIHVPFCRVLATYTDKADPIHHLYPHSYITLPFVCFFLLFFFSFLVFVLLGFFLLSLVPCTYFQFIFHYHFFQYLFNPYVYDRNPSNYLHAN